MRGKGDGAGYRLVQIGITPAYAGKRCCCVADCGIAGDHPRVCGEKYRYKHFYRWTSGSPPRMRGKVFQQLENGKPAGITPAYAGKRTISHGHYGDDRDHPRVCGEKNGQACNFFRKPGSPPRMRGKVRLVRIEPERRGDHPRVCGEKFLFGVQLVAVQGSPPRMRGKAEPITDRAVVLGITPAYAGKSHQDESSVMELQDHPRVCGEKPTTGGTPVEFQGSPPRMRGKARARDLERNSDRITPAYAGKRAPAPPAALPFGDHPRVCGEKGSRISPVESREGSPPRMRGKD